MPTTLAAPEAATPSKPPIGPSAAAAARNGGLSEDGGNNGGSTRYRRSDSSASLADADGACAGGVRDVSLPGQPLSRTRPLRSAAEAGSAPTIWIPLLNRGTVFTKEERRALRLEGLLPPAVESLGQQAARVLRQLRDECTSPLERYARLAWLAASNITLFYHVLMENLEELAPVVYTPTVGEACQKFSAAYRTPQGMFFDARGDAGRFGHLLRNWPNHNVQIIVITDGSRILGCVGLSLESRVALGSSGGFPSSFLPRAETKRKRNGTLRKNKKLETLSETASATSASAASASPRARSSSTSAGQASTRSTPCPSSSTLGPTASRFWRTRLTWESGSRGWATRTT